MFTTTALAIGAIAALVTGLSKTALPGAGLLATPLFALIADGRMIAGVALPVLIFADIYAIRWYRSHTRWDLLRPLVVWVAAGFGLGAAFFLLVDRVRTIEVVIACAIIAVVGVQVVRMLRNAPPRPASRTDAALYGTTGGFSTFVANAAGPIMNTYLVGLGLDRQTLVGTSAWFYFAVNLAKIPFYLALGHFFTLEGLLYDLCLFPVVLVGLYTGRALLPRLHDRLFVWVVLALSLGGAVRLLLA